ncbi:hypothetical protein F511_43321 [Dorcoceras hygrometricum]|uniref:Uncharacterized protein n=1 Tax=Dorcoceras hygrometricum TaxID=472368 RepID=A0A2Z7A694_9LAMI|nr:hypothetical protein F511_43321 [Dorcoceras hygrometricum]
MQSAGRHWIRVLHGAARLLAKIEIRQHGYRRLAGFVERFGHLAALLEALHAWSLIPGTFGSSCRQL